MRMLMRGFLAASVLAGSSVALAQRTGDVQRFEPATIEFDKVRDASKYITKIVNLRTGETMHGPGQATRGATVVYDNFTAPAQDPNLPANYAWAGPAEKPILCNYPVSDERTNSLYLIPLGSVGCASFPASSGRDILWDPMRFGNGAALDQLHTITQIDGSVVNTMANGPGTDITVVVAGSEWIDFDNDGIFEVLDGVAITFDFEPNAVPAVYRYSTPLDPSVQIQMYGEGAVLYDMRDPNTGGPICGTGAGIAGGNPVNLFETDPNCERPEDLMTVGSVYVTGVDPTVDPSDPNIPGDWWVGHTSDPNVLATIDPNADGAPGVSYTDIWTSTSVGFGTVVYGQAGFGDLALSHALRLFATAGGEPCLGDCNGDGERNVTDLGALLSGFNQSPGPCDTNGDGATNITDLGDLLSAFNTPCQ